MTRYVGNLLMQLIQLPLQLLDGLIKAGVQIVARWIVSGSRETLGIFLKAPFGSME